MDKRAESSEPVVLKDVFQVPAVSQPEPLANLIRRAATAS